MWNEILNIMIQCCHQAYQWFFQLFGGMTNGASGPWFTYFGIICSILACRFVLYPFLKGRVVGGIGEEMNRAKQTSFYDTRDLSKEDVRFDYMGNRMN